MSEIVSYFSHIQLASLPTRFAYLVVVLGLKLGSLLLFPFRCTFPSGIRFSEKILTLFLHAVTFHICCLPLQAVYTQIRTDRMSVLIWIQTV